MRRSTRKPMEERFWAKVNKTESCWEWTAAIRPDGYGQIGRGGKYGGNALAHRFSWELHCGSIPEGMLIDHRCHNRKCVNPDHLRTVTNKQNCENLRGPDKSTTTGVRGVTWDKENNKYLAQVGHNYKHINAGRYATLEEAAEAVRLKRLELFTHSDLDRLSAESPSSR